MRVKALLLASLSLSLLVLAVPAFCQSAPIQPLTTTELVAWLTAGVSGTRLARMVGERGLATLPTNRELRQVESAGAGKDLMRVLGSGNVQSAHIGPAIPAALLRASVEARAQKFHEAETELRTLVAADPTDSALHSALGTMLRQQEQYDDAYDELVAALKLMPDLPENHSALSYLFYRLDDGPNAIAEARTALSIDPKNSEAYQFLGIGPLLARAVSGRHPRLYGIAGARAGQSRYVLRLGHCAARRRGIFRLRLLRTSAPFNSGPHSGKRTRILA